MVSYDGKYIDVIDENGPSLLIFERTWVGTLWTFVIGHTLVRVWSSVVLVVVNHVKGFCTFLFLRNTGQAN
jgi:hypothetical protein